MQAIVEFFANFATWLDSLPPLLMYFVIGMIMALIGFLYWLRKRS